MTPIICDYRSHLRNLLFKQAMLHDSLVGEVCNPEEVWQMADEMLAAQAAWLPQYAEAIPAAQTRLGREILL